MDILARISLIISLLIASSSASEREQAAKAYYENGDYAQAAALFENYHWKALALVQSDQMRAAQGILSRLDDSDALYNLGLVYAQQGLLNQALESFQRVLEREPNADDARTNARIISEMLLARAQQSRDGLGSEQVGESQTAQDEGEGGRSGASGEEDSEQSNQQGDKGQSSDNANPGEQQSDGDAERTGGNNQNDNSDRIEGEVGDFATKTQRAGVSADDQSRQSDDDYASLQSEQRDLKRQAMEQWFNRIQHDNAKFLRERLEMMSASRRDILADPEVR